MTVRRVLLALLATGLVATAIGGAHATMTSTTENPGNSIATPTVFPYTIFSSAWDVNDASNGTAADRSPYLAFADSREYNFGGTYTTYQATRYARFDLGERLRDGLAVSSAVVNVRYRAADSSDNACFRVNMHRRSDQASLGSTFPQYCTTSTAWVNQDVTVTSQVATSDVANDLSVRVNGWYEDSTDSTDNDWLMDSLTLTITTAEGTLVIYPDVFIDVTDANSTNGGAGGMCQSSQSGTGAEGPWGLLSLADSACLYGNANWTTTSYNAARYIDFVVPANSVPAAASIFRVTLTHAWRPLAANNTCYFVEARQGGAAVSTHGSSGSPLACSSTTGSNSTQTVVLTGVNTATEVRGLSIRLYYWSAASTMTRHDELELDIKYS